MSPSPTLAIVDSHPRFGGSDSPGATTVAGLEDLACPRCAGALRARHQGVDCDACGASYPVDEGIVDTRCGRHDYYFNPVPPEKMQALIRDMTADNWPRTIREFIRHARMNTSWLDNLIVDGRYAWKLLLDLSKNMKVLDLGCGLGNLTHNLAPLVGRVYAMDLTYPRLQFSRRRFELFNRDDDIVAIAGGDGKHLPFRSQSLDCVVLSGVLEWVGEGDTAPLEAGSKLTRVLRMLKFHFGSRNPRQIQLRFLSEIRRVLKPGGQLFVAIENRLNYEYFAGRRDHHSLLYFGSLLPRLLATVYSIAVNRKPYRTYTYSIPGYRGLLAEAGFPNIEFLGLSRGYSSLEEILPADVDAPAWQPPAPSDWKDRIRRNKYFVPAYGIVSSAAAKPWARRQDAVLAQVEQDLRRGLGEGRFLQHTYTITGRDKLIVRASYANQPVIVRVPMNDAAREWEATNARMLQHLAASPRAGGTFPRHFGCGEVDGIWYSVEAHLAGQPLAEVLPRQGRCSMLQQVEQLLESLNPASLPRTRARLEGDTYDRHVGRWIDAVSSELGDPQLRRRSHAFFRSRLHGAEVTTGLMHGDFGTRNILVHDGRIGGLIDWESGDVAGIPLLDAVSYLASVQLLFNPAQRMGRIYSDIAARRWPENAEQEFLARSFASQELDPARHEGWVYLAWLRGAVRRLSSTLRFDPLQIESEVAGVLRGLEA